MTFSEFTAIVNDQLAGVILLEGRRAIPAADYVLATRLARRLAIAFPRLRFRSGNAGGSDEAFSEGVAQVDAGRLQVVAPHSAHRSRLRHPAAVYESPDSLPKALEEQIAHKTVQATPKNRRLIEKRHVKGPMGAKAAYLIRDTMKVTGHSDNFSKPICALFYVDLNDPQAGGTGHTIRVCRQENVPVAFQDSWQGWLEQIL